MIQLLNNNGSKANISANPGTIPEDRMSREVLECLKRWPRGPGVRILVRLRCGCKEVALELGNVYFLYPPVIRST